MSNLSPFADAFASFVQAKEKKGEVMKFDSNYFIWLYGHMWVHVPTCEKMLVVNGYACSLKGVCGEKVFLPQEQVDKLCQIEDEINNYLQY